MAGLPSWSLDEGGEHVILGSARTAFWLEVVASGTPPRIGSSPTIRHGDPAVRQWLSSPPAS